MLLPRRPSDDGGEHHGTVCGAGGGFVTLRVAVHLPPCDGRRYNAAVGGGMMGMYEAYAAVYDQSGQLAFDLRMVPYLQRLLQEHPVAGREMIELACGTGTIAVAMAQAGWQVTGVDLSAAMLTEARRKAEAAAQAITWRRQDMRQLTVERPVDLITCLYDSINYMLTSEDLLATFRRVHAALRPGGLFLFDMNTAYAFESLWDDVTYYTDGDALCTVLTCDYDAYHQQTAVVVTCFRRVGALYEKLQERHVEQAYPAEQVATLLTDAGLRVEASYDCFHLAPHHDESTRILWAARRKER